MKIRIIGGEFKGRYINVPKSDLIRPITDRVKETLFNILNNKIDFRKIKVLELYAGSGSIGLECLSRGAARIDFVEKNFVIYKNLEENIKSLGVSGNCNIYKMDALNFSKHISEDKYDLIIADPPFYKSDIYKVIEYLEANKYFDNDPLTIVRRSVQTKSDDINSFKTEPFKIIGDSCLYQLTPKN
jgi:16S rRNA (guanine966-N2)-methyltransferase